MADFTKDPNANLDYQIDWSDWLDGDTISNSAWTVPSGLTEESSSNTTTTATIWLSGGTVGQTYAVVNQITTAGGRIQDWTIEIQVRER